MPPHKSRTSRLRGAPLMAHVSQHHPRLWPNELPTECSGLFSLRSKCKKSFFPPFRKKKVKELMDGTRVKLHAKNRF
jgi:hypothetical protein